MSTALNLIVRSALSGITDPNELLTRVARWSGCIFSDSERPKYAARRANIQLLCQDLTKFLGVVRTTGKVPDEVYGRVPGGIQKRFSGLGKEMAVVVYVLSMVNVDTYYYIRRDAATSETLKY